MYSDQEGTFSFHSGIPPEVLSAIKEHLLPLERILPKWVQLCTIEWNDVETEAAITCYTNYCYRRFTLVFAPGWLSGSPERRREMLIHDVLHSYTGILADYSRDELKRAIPKDESGGRYLDSVIDELTARHEAMTQDFTALIVSLLPG
jgi:hypothetical protein